MSSASGSPRFLGGVNIALKVPPHQFEETERCYVETVGLPVVSRTASSVELEFGPNRLWLDRVPTVSQAEIWLEIVTDDLSAAQQRLHTAGVTRCDEIEPLPEDLTASWITNPAQIVHLVLQEDA